MQEDGESVQKVVPNVALLKNRALLRELIDYNPAGNFDRIRALGAVMLYRGQFIDMYEGDMSRAIEDVEDPAWDDDYFKAYDNI